MHKTTLLALAGGDPLGISVPIFGILTCVKHSRLMELTKPFYISSPALIVYPEDAAPTQVAEHEEIHDESGRALFSTMLQVLCHSASVIASHMDSGYDLAPLALRRWVQQLEGREKTQNEKGKEKDIGH